MQRALSRLDRMRANPQGDWRNNDIESLSREYGLVCTPPRGGGSNYKVSDPDGDFTLIVPSRRPIKPIYIRALVGFIIRMREGQA